MRNFKAILTVTISIGMLATLSGAAVAQNYTRPADTSVRALEPPIDVTPGQLRAGPRRDRIGSPEFQALAPRDVFGDER